MNTHAIPAAMQIESAIDGFKYLPQNVRTDETTELLEVGERAVCEIGASGLSGDLIIGYLLGLETARVMLASTPQAVEAGVKL
jgi:hypothetical protein